MLNPDAVDEIATKLVPENFFRPAHQLIYAGILELNTRHIPIDQISLADRLAAEGQLEDCGRASLLGRTCQQYACSYQLEEPYRNREAQQRAA